MSVVTIVRHRVADYDAWKKVYDSVAPLQKAGGVMAHGIFRSEENANDIIVLHTFADSASAHAFFDSAEIKQAMAGGGVDFSTFKLEFADEVSFGRL